LGQRWFLTKLDRQSPACQALVMKWLHSMNQVCRLAYPPLFIDPRDLHSGDRKGEQDPAREATEPREPAELSFH
jgi:hypothetical protein